MTTQNDHRFRWRAFLSLTLFFAFILLAFSGLALYLRPEGSVARWVGWRLMGLDKSGWEGFHTLFCIAFTVTAVIHLFLNIKALLRYIRRKAVKRLRLSRELSAALILVSAMVLTAVLRIPPLSKVMEWRATIKNGSRLVQTALPEADFEKKPLTEVAAFMGISIDTLVGTLFKQGLDIPSPGLSLQDIARHNGLSPQNLYGRILQVPRKKTNPSSSLE